MKQLILICAAIIGLTGYFLLVLATRKGDVSVIAPFRYSRLLFLFMPCKFNLRRKTYLAHFIWGLLVVGSGIYTLGAKED